MARTKTTSASKHAIVKASARACFKPFLRASQLSATAHFGARVFVSRLPLPWSAPVDGLIHARKLVVEIADNIATHAKANSSSSGERTAAIEALVEAEKTLAGLESAHGVRLAAEYKQLRVMAWAALWELLDFVNECKGKRRQVMHKCVEYAETSYGFKYGCFDQHERHHEQQHEHGHQHASQQMRCGEHVRNLMPCMPKVDYMAAYAFFPTRHAEAAVSISIPTESTVVSASCAEQAVFPATTELVLDSNIDDGDDAASVIEADKAEDFLVSKDKNSEDDDHDCDCDCDAGDNTVLERELKVSFSSDYTDDLEVKATAAAAYAAEQVHRRAAAAWRIRAHRLRLESKVALAAASDLLAQLNRLPEEYHLLSEQDKKTGLSWPVVLQEQDVMALI